MNRFFSEVNKNFGFGCMRLPLKDGKIDIEEFKRMVDAFIEGGFNYFDTAHGYMEGKSEGAIKEALTSRYPRSSYVLTDKLSSQHFETGDQIRPLFESELKACGVDYFDFYLMHAQNRRNFEKFKMCRAYETALELKKEGLIRHFGISFHDRAEVLDRILNEYPEIEAVQIQFNYLDYDDEAIESRKCYEVIERHNKPVIVMEPVKGGKLASLTKEAQKIIDDLHGGSSSSYAIRFAAGFPSVMMVLSGMSTLDMVKENVSFMGDFKELTESERDALRRVVSVYRKENLIPCTTCRYCMERCPKHIRIPELFTLLNAKRTFQSWNTDYYYNNVHTDSGTRAKDCLKCGRCEEICPQHLEIRRLLEEVSKEFDK